MACVYILYSQSLRKFYTGSSRDNDARMRLMAHNAGRTKSTKAGRPWLIVIEESYANYMDARKRENFLKSGIGRKWIKESLLERCQSG